MLVGGEDSYEKSLRGGRDSSRFTVHSGFDSRGSLVKSRERDETTWKWMPHIPLTFDGTIMQNSVHRSRNI